MRKSFFVVLWLSLMSGIVHAQGTLGEARVFQHDDGRTMPYRFLPPASVDASESYPLIVFLHGAGERGTDNRIQMQVHINGLREATQTEQYASYMIAPQLPAGNTFWDPNQAYDLTMDIIRSVSENNAVDPSRIYVTGLSLGGFGSFNYVSQFPEFFAAAAPLSGWGDPTAAERISDVPIWTFHGDLDSAVNVSGSRDMFYAIDQAGGGAMHTDIHRGGHVIWSPIYSDWETGRHGLYPWMFSKSIPALKNEQLVKDDTTWRFLDDGSDQGMAWREPSFDDASWKEGQGQFGYGERDQMTVINCGPSAPDCDEGNFATSYFRTTFVVEDVDEVASLSAVLLRDDSAAVYINGAQVFRDSSLPEDATFETYAGNLENSHVGFTIDPSVLQAGENVIAVEVHQRSDNNSDVSFDFRLSAQSVPEPGTMSIGCLATLLLAVGMRRRNS